MTPTQRILERDNYQCQYCGKRAVQRDHVYPVRLKRRCERAGIDREALENQVACCMKCNVEKGNRCLVPPSWADRIPELEEAIGKVFHVFDGEPVRELLI